MAGGGGKPEIRYAGKGVPGSEMPSGPAVSKNRILPPSEDSVRSIGPASVAERFPKRAAAARNAPTEPVSKISKSDARSGGGRQRPIGRPGNAGAWPGLGGLVLTETEAGIVVREVISRTADAANPAPRILRGTTTIKKKAAEFLASSQSNRTPCNDS